MKLIISLFCLLPISLSAQYSIAVLDKDLKQPVAGASVYFPDLRTSAETDGKGVFVVNGKNTSILVQISCVGYKTFLGTLQPKNTPVVYLESSYYDLQEIVVSGNGSKLQGENVSNVETLNLSDNAEAQGFSLSQKLTSVAGVSSLGTGTGIGKPVIRGLSGNRIAVFAQGVRIENQQWGDEHGLGLDENGYEQVEIVKGPSSLLYGSDALGGVLYFTGERYAKENSIETALNSEYHSNTNGWRNTAAFKASKGRFHYNLFAGNVTHQDYSDGDNNRVANSRFRTNDAKVALGYTGDKFTTSLKYSLLHEQYGLTEAPEEDAMLPANGRKPLSPYQDLSTHIVSSENMYFFADDSRLKLNVGYVFNNRKEFEEDEAALNMNLGTCSYDLKWYSPRWNEHWLLTVGSQGMYQTNTNKGEEMLIPDAVTADAGVFAVADYYYSEKSYWQAGLRVDGRHISGKQYGEKNDETYFPRLSKSYTSFNFSTGVYHRLDKSLSLRATVSSGYRSPNMFELLSDGVHEGTNRYETGNTALKPENSYQADVSFSYEGKRLEVYVNPYFNYISRYIHIQPSGEIRDDVPVYYYTQTDARLYGSELGCHYHPQALDWLHLEGSYSSTLGEDAGSKHLPLMPSQKLNATVRASFEGKKIVKKLSVYLQDRYSFAQNRVSDYEMPTAAYNLINAGLTLEFKFGKQPVLFNLTAHNLLNESYYDHLSRYKQEGIYEPGRNLSFKVSLPVDFAHR